MGESLSALFLQNPQLAIALRRQQEGREQYKKGADYSPIRSPWQGAARLAEALLGGYESRKGDEDAKAAIAADQAGVSDFTQSIAAALAGRGGAQPGAGALPPAQTDTPSAPSGSAGRAALPIAATMLAPEAKALLAGVSGAESPGYNVRYGGSTFDNFADHPRSAIPIMGGPMAGQTSSAAGRYQFLAPTWDAVRAKNNLPDFSPQSQDMGAWALARDTYQTKTGRDLIADLRSGDPALRQGVTEALKGQWPSLPGGNQPNAASGGFWQRYDAAMQQGATPQQAQQAAAVSLTSTDPAQGAPSPQPQQVASAGPVPPVGTAGGAPMPQGAPAPAPQPPVGGAAPMAPQAGLAPPAAGGGAPGAIPINSALQSPLAGIYLRGLSSNNPRIRAMAQGLAPFIKQESPNFQIHNIGGQMFAVNPQDPNQRYPLGASEAHTPLPQSVEEQKLRLQPPTPLQSGNTYRNPTTGAPILGPDGRPIPGAPPATAEAAVLQAGAAQPGGNSAQAVNQAVTDLKTSGELGQVYAKRAEQTLTYGDKARGQAQQIQQLEAIAENLQTGRLAPAMEQISGWGKALGLDFSKLGVGDVAGMSQAYSAIVNKLAQSAIGGEGGFPTQGFSNADRDFVVKQVANISNDPFGNRVLLQSARAVADRTAAKADAMTEYLASGGKNVAQFERDWNARMRETPLFPAITRDQLGQAQPGVYAIRNQDGRGWEVAIKPPVAPGAAGPQPTTQPLPGNRGQLNWNIQKGTWE